MSDDQQKSQAETTQVTFSLDAGMMKMDTCVQVPVGQTNPTQLLPVLQQLTNEIVSAVGEVFRTGGQPISCRAGCAACCRHLVPISLFEAEALAEWMRSLPEDRQEQLLARFSSAMQQLQERGLLARMGSLLWTQTIAESERFMSEYLQARVPCPFLENESCGIYPIRPLICREYVVTSSPEFCEVPVREKIMRIDIPIKPSNALFRMGSRIERNHRGWFPLVFLIEWMKVRGTPGEAFSGTGPEVLYAFLQNLSDPKDESPVESIGQ